MSIALNQLPDDVNALKALVSDQVVRNEQLQADKQAVVEKNERLTTENQRYKVQVLTLTEQLNLALARRYAASSEKIATDTANGMLGRSSTSYVPGWMTLCRRCRR